jgi:hypothetical protein
MVLFPVDANDNGEWLRGLEQISAPVRTVRLKAKNKSKKMENFTDRRQQRTSTVKMKTALLKLDLPRPINGATAH